MTAYFATGSDIAVNTQTTGTQRMQSATRLSDGSFIVAWETTDALQDGSSSAIKMQRFSATGAKLGSEGLVNSATAGSQINPQVAALANGSFVVTWQTGDSSQDGSGSAIKAQMFGADGLAIGAEFLVDTQGALNQERPVITALAGGGFVVAWQTTDTTQDGSGTAIRAQAYDAAGNNVGSEFLVNTTAAGNQTIDDIVALADGGFLLTWTGSYGSSSEIFGQAYNADGSASGGEFLITLAAGNQSKSTVAALADGGFVVAWYAYDTGVQAQRFDANHNAVGGQLIPASSVALNGSSPDITTLSNGDFVISWQVSGQGVYVQAFSPAGIARGNASIVPWTSGDGSSYSSSPIVALDGGGFAIVASNTPSANADLSLMLYRLNQAPELGSAIRSIAVSEGTSSSISALATDDGGPVAPTYAIIGGADAARFTLDQYSGQLRFISSPNFEAPADADANNVYEVVIRASDGDLADEQTILVTVNNVNESPVISSNGGGSSAAIAVAENSLTVSTVTAADPDGTAVTYAIIGGVDAARFAIDASTGALRFLAAPNFEAPIDAGANNVYNLTIAATSGGISDLQSLTVTVTDVNEVVTITSNGAGTTATLVVAENSTAVTAITANTFDGSTPTYTIAGGADQALFTINALTGALSFVTAPDFEAPADAGANNVYDVIVAASDATQTDTQAISVTVGNVAEGVSITSGGGGASATVSINENSSTVTSVVAVDGDGDAIAYAIAGGADADLFAIDATTGALSFLNAPNFEAPADADADNVYDVIVSASDGGLTDTQAIAVSLSNLNEGLNFDHFSAGSIVASVSENTDEIADVSATDPDGDAISYVLAGEDAALFMVDENGKLRFIDAPDFEAQGSNSYNVSVIASDGQFSTTLGIIANVLDVNEAISITSFGGSEAAAVAVSENNPALFSLAASDPDGDVPAFAITGGADAARFMIDAATGALTFVTVPNFEAPADAGANNVYDVEVSASDGQFSDALALSVTVENVNEGVTIDNLGSGGGIAVLRAENSALVVIVSATDADGDAVTFSLGGDDAALFSIDSSSGALSFITAPDYEAPNSLSGTNNYRVNVIASDGQLTDSKALQVIVLNQNEAIVITSNGGGSAATIATEEDSVIVTTVTASDVDGDAPYYAIVGGADAAHFGIDSATGSLFFLTAPNFEAPADAGTDNVYDVVVAASDGQFSDSQALAITVGNANEALSLTSNGGGTSATVTLDENGIQVTTVLAVDPEGGPIAYSISGGADQAKFTINATTGALIFLAAPNFEAPADAGANNIYDVIVQASDGTHTVSQAIAAQVVNVNEALAISSNGGGSSAALSIAENGTAVTTVAASDPDGTAIGYSIAGGADAAKFTINATTGALRFVTGPNFEAPGDAGANNVYDVVVGASDGVFSDTQALAVTVTNLNEGATITGTSANNTISTTTTVSGQPRATALEDTIFGLGGADTLSGGGGNDIIDGGTGNDTIRGQAGADRLTGGTGADTFILDTISDSTTSASDVITDFKRSEGDRISLNPIDANANAGGNQNFTFIGTAAFSGVAGQAHYQQSGGNTFITGDVNGDSVADFQIQLNGLVNLVSSDFIL